MCGPSEQQEQLSDEQSAFYQQLTQQDATTFGEDQGILQQVQSAYAPILAAGANQYGFNAAETNNLNTTATEGVAKNYAAASTALKENQAAQGGGNTYLSSGVSAQQNAGLATSAAQQQSDEQLQIQQAGYQQGYNQFTQATSALEGAEGLNNSTNYASAANSGGEAAESTDASIVSENDSWMAPLLGAVGSVGAAATGKLIK